MEGIERLSQTDVELLHVDVVDGKFVKGRKIPFRILKKIYKYTSKRLDVHLMVQKPKKYIKAFSTMNTERITIHIEVEKDLEKNLQLIRNYGIQCGLAINPKTELEKVYPYFNQIDSILIMAAEPGYGGQPFLPETEEKIKKLKAEIKKRKKDITITVDCGINQETIQKVREADIIVSGSFITKEENFQKQIDLLRKGFEKEKPEPKERKEEKKKEKPTKEKKTTTKEKKKGRNFSSKEPFKDEKPENIEKQNTKIEKKKTEKTEYKNTKIEKEKMEKKEKKDGKKEPKSKKER